ncbi:acyltransferase family protein [Bacillus sp. FJAT-49732]|uniref:Acyltransferase family protein n=2 Tax=Lederbergia citrisecunda TaxID=2833583 RepID=A0A942TLH4_9BACI|nr:acyltransferase family protein [Lederbergia citrisecunda]MBS4198429.1 acyltransferase family protein [Lederbergia citrisecunda]
MYKGFEVKGFIEDFINSNIKISVLYYGTASASYHLWFLTALIWSIFILFIFIKINKLKYLLFSSFILNVIGLFGQTYSGIFHLSINTIDALFFGLFYTTTGCFIAYHIDFFKRFFIKGNMLFIAGLFLVSTLMQMLESYITVIWWNGTKGGIAYYLSPIPQTFTLFILIIKNKEFGKNTIFSLLGKNSLGIYLVHLIFINIAYYGIHFLNVTDFRKHFIFNLLLAVIILLISLQVTIFLQAFVSKIIKRFKRLFSGKGFFPSHKSLV